MLTSNAWPGSIALVLVLVLVLATSESEAWADWAAQVDIGGQIGFSSAKLAGPGANGQLVRSSYGLGVSAGAAVGIHLNNLAAAHMEILYTLKRSHSTSNGTYFGTFHLKYLEVPLLARISLPVSDSIECYGTVGPVLGILLDADVYLADGEHVDAKRSIEPIDAGLMLGAGTAIRLGDKGALTFDLRYNHGLRNVDKNAAPENDDAMNRAFYFTVGYRANLGDLLHGFRRKAPPPAHKLPSAPEPDAAPTDTLAPDTEPAPTEPMSPLNKPHAPPPDHL